MPRWKGAETAEAIVWWAAAFGIWLVSLSATSLQEFIVAAAASAPCGPLAVLARRATRNRWTVRPSWYARVLRLPFDIVADAGRAFAAAAMRRPGTFEIIDTGAPGDSVEAVSRRALEAALISVSPGRYVIDDREDGTLVVHNVGKR